MTTYQACREFTFAGQRYERGDAFTQKRPAIQIAGMLRARMIKKVFVDGGAIDITKDGDSVTQTFRVTPGESIHVATPKRRRKR